MTEVDISLLIGALLVALVARNWRIRLWIGAAAVSYINATIAWRLHIPYAEAITGMGDAAVCLTVYFVGREIWELIVWRLFQVSVAISMFFLAGNLGIFLNVSHEFYSILMEALNWMLLLLIGGMSIMQLMGSGNVGARRPWNRVRDFARALQQTRKTHSFLHHEAK